jgi:acetyl esterase/lipase
MLDDSQRIDNADIAKGAGDTAGAWRIWPGNGVPPGSEDWDWHERTTQVPWTSVPRLYARNVVVPTVTVHRPAPGTANGTALVVAPGGAFHFLMMEHEGHTMARWLSGLGITVLVLKYRLMRTPDDDALMLDFRTNLQKRLGQPAQDENAPPSRDFLREVRLLGEEDGRQAIRFARDNASDLGIKADRVGIAGYSAGGGVSMGAAMQHDAASRPDYAIGIYPAWRAELTVPANAPPLFLAISDDDKSVAAMSATRLYDAWHKSGSSAELHVFANGGHGWGMDTPGYLSDIWTKLLENWLRFHKYI